MPEPFELFLDGPPISQQTRRREQLRRWRDDVRQAAIVAWDDRPIFPGPVLVAITYFYDDVMIDVDNLPKPILDALKGWAFADDADVTDLWVRKRPAGGIFLTLDASEALLDRLALSSQFIHIVVADAPNQETL